MLLKKKKLTMMKNQKIKTAHDDQESRMKNMFAQKYKNKKIKTEIKHKTFVK